VLQDQQSIQQPKRDRRHHEQVYRGNTVGMIVKEGLPALRRRAALLCHILGHRGLPDLNTKLEQLAMDARCVPEGIGDAHLANELANIGCGTRSAASGSRFPPPIGPKAGAMPADHSIRVDDLQGVENVRRQRVKTSEHHPVDTRESNTSRSLAAEHVQLVPKYQILGFQRCPRPE
jgi:hypothetical protein